MELFLTYSTDEVAEVAQVTRRTVYNWIETGRLPAHKVGPKRWVVYQDVLQVYLAGGDAHPVFAAIQSRQNAPLRVDLQPAAPVVPVVPVIPAPVSTNKPHSSSKKKPRR